MDQIYFSVEETARILGISPRTIYNSIHRSSTRQFIKPHRFGNKPLFHKDDIEAFAKTLPTESPTSRRGRKAEATQ